MAQSLRISETTPVEIRLPAESNTGRLLDLAKQAYEQYAPELRPTLETMQKVFGDTAAVTGRAKEAGSATNRLQRAVDNGWVGEIKTVSDAISNTWDAFGARAIVRDTSLQGMNNVVNRLSAAIEQGNLSVHKINNLVGNGGIPYLNKAHLGQLARAASSTGKVIDVETIKYNTGYTGGMVYFKTPSGVHGELQIMGQKVKQLSDLEHIPYDAFLNKPYAGGFSAENLPHAAKILDPIRAAARGLDAPAQNAYRDYLNEQYINARKMEQGLPSNPPSLPKGIPALLDVQNLGGANRALELLKGANTVDAASSSGKFGGTLYPPEKMHQLVQYLEKRGVSVYGTQGSPSYKARADGTGMMLLPENPTVLQVKHELSHYLDHKKLGFESYKDLGRVGREQSVLTRLENNRVWSQLNTREQSFSRGYVDDLMNGRPVKHDY